MQGDAREDWLCRYDAFVRVLDLDAPRGFSRMADFNRELNAFLDRHHPDTREYVNQSLRGGTQTPQDVLGAGHRARRFIATEDRRSVGALHSRIAAGGSSLPGAARGLGSSMRALGLRGSTMAVFTPTMSTRAAGSVPATTFLCRMPWRTLARGRVGSSSENRRTILHCRTRFAAMCSRGSGAWFYFRPISARHGSVQLGVAAHHHCLRCRSGAVEPYVGYFSFRSSFTHVAPGKSHWQSAPVARDRRLQTC